MRFGNLLVALLAAAVALFALQNTDQTAVRFAFWRLDRVPIAGLVLGSLGAGVLIAGLPLWIKLRIWRSRARALEARVGRSETTFEEPSRRPSRMPPQH